ncbi:MAG: hypothetical protein JWM57_2636 [Phycisphaerales bacterium]|nr:hypothetical protein [Phycisphaerales bacterium]
MGCARPAPAEAPVLTTSIVRQNPAQHLFVARINLADPRVSVVMASGGADPDGDGPWETVLRPPSAIARDNGFAITVNTVFFGHHAPDGDLHKFAAGEAAAGQNLVVIDGRAVTRATSGALLWFDADNRAHVDDVSGTIPAGAKWAAAGSRLILQNGQNVAGAGDNTRHPRTVAGISADGRTLTLIVADGRRPGWGAGFTMAEMADELIAQGCTAGVNFDGGGSSTFVARTREGRYRVLNTPSDGSTFIVPLSIERPVPYVLGVKIKSE